MRNIVFWAAPFLLLTSIEGRAAAQASRPVRNQTLVGRAPAPAHFEYWTGAMVVGDTLVAIYNEQRRDPIECVRLDTGAVTAQGVGVPAPIRQLQPDELVWRTTVAGGLVIAASAEPPALTAYEPCSLRRRWSVALRSAETIPALAAVGDKIAAAVTSNAPAGWTYQLYDAHSGALLAKGSRLEQRPPDRLIADGDRVLAVAGIKARPDQQPSATIEIAALDARDGRRLWAADVANGAVAFGGGAVVIAAGGTFQVLDAASGAKRLEAPGPAMDLYVPIDMLTGGGSVYYLAVSGEGPGTVGAIDLTTGRPLWQRSLPVLASLALDDDVLYVETDDGFLTALDRRDGRAAWRWSVGRRVSDLRVATLPSGRRRLVVVDSGGDIWTLARGARPAPSAEPIIVEGQVHMEDGDSDARQLQLVVAGRRIETDRQGRFQTVVRARGSAFSVVSRAPWAVISRHRRPAPADEEVPPPTPSLLLPPDQPRHYVLNLDARYDYPEDCH